MPRLQANAGNQIRVDFKPPTSVGQRASITLALLFEASCIQLDTSNRHARKMQESIRFPKSGSNKTYLISTGRAKTPGCVVNTQRSFSIYR
jgi:hypothetical protein